VPLKILRSRPYPRRPSPAVAAANGPPRRLLPFILSAPKRIEDYFERSLPRRVLWCTISAGAGYYGGNVLTLSFGALAVNDILAAVVTLLFYEAVSAAFYGASKPTLRLWFANYFKMGLVAATMADALKLGS
jgi:hypothetical protein